MSGGHLPQHTSNEKYAESMMNMALLDPPRWGWSAVGGIADLLAPHERARRKQTKKAFLRANKRKRGRPHTNQSPTNGNSVANASLLKSPPLTAEKSLASQSQDKPLGDQKAAAAAAASTPASTAAPTQPGAAETSGDQALPQPSTSTTTDEKNKDNPQLPKQEEDAKPAAKPTESLPTNGDSQPKILQDEDKATPPAPTAECTSKPKSSNDTTPTDGAMTETKPQPPALPTETPQAVTTVSQKSDEATTTAATTTTTIREPEVDENNVLKIEALTGDGALDIYAYHRGREGLEPRDAATGELLCDVEPTDTNYKWDEPKLTLQVTVSFSLNGDNTTSAEEGPVFEDTIHWNLGDPETPTPIAFATATAEQFGLSFGQTQDLAVSIQQQIYRHVRDHCGYAEPVGIKEGGSGIERTHFPPPTVCHMYGSGIAKVVPGTFCANAVAPAKSKYKKQSYASQGSSSRRRDGSSISHEETVRQRPPPIEYYDDEPVEDIYVDEVKKRMIEYSKADVAIKCEEAGKPLGQLILQRDYVCHICHKRHSLVGKFACGFTSHSYCRPHLQNRLGLEIGGADDEVAYDHCPICAVTCKCSKCGRRREALGVQLKRKAQKQGTEPSSTVFDDMFSCLTKPGAAIRMVKQAKRRETTGRAPTPPPRDDNDSAFQEKPKGQPKAKAKANRKSSVREPEDEAPSVVVAAGAKPPPNHFPREIRGGMDVDPGSALDYRTVYTAEGHYVKDLASLPKATQPKGPDAPPVVAEDGNVDYCQICKKGGSLLCCDYCPRAFHPRCLNESDNDESGGTWECPTCKRAKEDLPEYTLSGAESQSKICAAFSELQVNDDDDLTHLTLLSKIHEMLEKLMQTDFGNVFAVPVDPRTPNYLNLIKKPMDLGTIASKLLNGGYKKSFEAHKLWTDVHLAVLKDVELVWHNCLTYNFEGSSYYKMAEDLRRHMMAMRLRSIDNDLPDTVLHKLEEYVKACRKERGKIPVPPQFDGRHKSRYKIEIPHVKVGRSTKVAILNPVTGMVVKIYTTIKSAHAAAQDLIKRGYQSELPHSYNEYALKALVKKSTDDPSATLFGHRWLELEKLRNDQVRFSSDRPPASTVFELKDGQSSHTFLSLDEAITHRLSRDKPNKELRKALEQLKEGGEGVIIFGLQWRRRKFVADGKALHKDVVLAPFWEKNGNKASKEVEEPEPTGTLVAKEDRILGRIVARFETLEAAFEDWQFACNASGSIPPDEISQSSFFTHYLNGDRNVDGVIWKVVEATEDDAKSEVRDSQLDETNMSQSPTLISNEEEKQEDKAVAVAEHGKAAEETKVKSEAMEVENDAAVPPVPVEKDSSATAADGAPILNGEDANSSSVAPILNGLKRGRSDDDEELPPSKK